MFLWDYEKLIPTYKKGDSKRFRISGGSISFTLSTSSGGCERALSPLFGGMGSPLVGTGPPLRFMSRTNPNPFALAWGGPGGVLIFQSSEGHWNGYEVSCPSLSPISCERYHSRFGSLFASQITATGPFMLSKFRILGVYEYEETHDPEVRHGAVIVQAMDESYTGSLLVCELLQDSGMLSPNLTLP